MVVGGLLESSGSLYTIERMKRTESKDLPRQVAHLQLHIARNLIVRNDRVCIAYPNQHGNPTAGLKARRGQGVLEPVYDGLRRSKK